jgi:hypothetical protein
MNDAFSSSSRLWLLLPLLACASCANDSGLAYQNLALQAFELDSSGAPTTSVGTKCTTLPELLGSEVDDQLALGAITTAQIAATRDRVTVRFTNTRGGDRDTQVITQDQLSSSYTQTFRVDPLSGPSYSIALSAECP